MAIPFALFYRDKSKVFFEFKNTAHLLRDPEFRRIYLDIEPVLFKRDSDLTLGCITTVATRIQGETVLDVGCGKGTLAALLSARYCVTATDIIIDDNARLNNPRIRFIEANAEMLPFKNAEFDTVICTHTLEHVRNIVRAIDELRRVAKKRIIVVVPKQRPYAYTFDLHLHFFPYAHILLSMMNCHHRIFSCEEINGDWLYIEDLH